MSSLENFRIASESLEAWTMDCTLYLGNPQPDGKHNFSAAIDWLVTVDERFDDTQAVICDWEDRIIACDSTGSGGGLEFAATAHAAALMLLYNVIASFQRSFEEKYNPPSNPGKWKAATWGKFCQWLHSQNSQGAVEASIRIQRERAAVLVKYHRSTAITRHRPSKNTETNKFVHKLRTKVPPIKWESLPSLVKNETGEDMSVDALQKAYKRWLKTDKS